jgi:hypothetical protein
MLQQLEGRESNNAMVIAKVSGKRGLRWGPPCRRTAKLNSDS